MQLSTQTSQVSLFHDVTLPKGRFILSGAQVLDLAQRLIETTSRLTPPSALYLGMGSFSEAAPLTAVLNRYPGHTTLYGYPDLELPLGNHVTQISLDDGSPLVGECFVFIYGTNLQLLFAAAPTPHESSFSCVLSRDHTVTAGVAKVLVLPSLDLSQSSANRHEVIAALLWQIATQFTDITPIARGIGNLGVPLGVAWLIINRDSERWKIAAQSLQGMVQSSAVSLYRLDVHQRMLTPLYSLATPSTTIALESDQLITRAVFANQILIGQNADGLHAVAIPMLQTDYLWGMVQVERAEPFSDADLAQLALFAELVKLALIAYDAPAPSSASALNFVPPPSAAPTIFNPLPVQPMVSSPANEKTPHLAVVTVPAAPVDAQPNFDESPLQAPLFADDVYWPELEDFERATSTVEMVAVRPSVPSAESPPLTAEPSLSAAAERYSPPLSELPDLELEQLTAIFDVDALNIKPLSAVTPRYENVPIVMDALKSAEPALTIPLDPPMIPAQWGDEIELLTQQVIDARDTTVDETPVNFWEQPDETLNSLYEDDLALESELNIEREQRQQAERALAQAETERRDLEIGLNTERALRMQIQDQLAAEHDARQEIAEGLARAAAERDQLDALLAQEQAAAAQAQAQILELETLLQQQPAAPAVDVLVDLRLFMNRIRERVLRLKPNGSTIPPAQQKLIDQVTAESGTAAAVLNELQQIQQVPNSRRQVFDLVPILRDLNTTVQQQHAARGIQIHLEFYTPQMNVSGDRELLVRAFYNLLVSAVYLASPTETVWLELGKMQGGAVLKMSMVLRDEFVGRMDGFLKHFDKGVPQRSGLALARSILVQHQGSLTVQELETKHGAVQIVAELPMGGA